MKRVCVVVPCYNEQENVTLLYERLLVVFAKQRDISWNILFVDDGSADETTTVVKKLIGKHDNIALIELSRNYGHQAALIAGLEHAEGDAVISMDADLQHPPELIPELLKLWDEGAEIVYTVRQDTEAVPLMKKLSSKLYYRLFNVFADISLVEGSADFRLYDASVIAVLNRYQERSIFLRGIVTQMGFKQQSVVYSAGQRHAGKSSYSLKKMLQLARDGITSFSVRPLRFAIYIGILFAVAAMCYVVYALLQALRGASVHGWASMTAGIFLMGGIQLIFLGVIGEYIGQIFNEVKRRPRYAVRKLYGNSNIMKDPR